MELVVVLIFISLSIALVTPSLWRVSKTIELKSIVDEAIKQAPIVEKVVVVKRTGSPITMNKGRDFWYSDIPVIRCVSCFPQLRSAMPLRLFRVPDISSAPSSRMAPVTGFRLFHQQDEGKSADGGNFLQALPVNLVYPEDSRYSISN